MALYSQRQFVKVYQMRTNGQVMPVLCFIWHNDSANCCGDRFSKTWGQLLTQQRTVADVIRAQLPYRKSL
ncbi:hypothetical protein ACVWZ4_003802 [Bradyrhizobium sp. USDA 4472]